MSSKSPAHPGILQLRDTEFAGVSTIGLVVDVLGGNFNVVLGQFPYEQEVQGRRRDNNLGVGVELGGVEVVDDGLDAVNGAIPVSSEELPVRRRWLPFFLDLTHILKFPPTKNLRVILAVVDESDVFFFFFFFFLELEMRKTDDDEENEERGRRTRQKLSLFSCRLERATGANRGRQRRGADVTRCSDIIAIDHSMQPSPQRAHRWWIQELRVLAKRIIAN